MDSDKKSFLKACIAKLARGSNMDSTETAQVMNAFMEGDFTPAQFGSIVMGLRLKGETVEELVGFLRVYRERGEKVLTTGNVPVVDLCGTGGDGPSANMFNISTTSSFVVVGAGVNVAKHGTKAVSSQSGSSDLLSELGINIHLSSNQLSDCLNSTGFCFMHGPNLNTAMQNVIALRQECGIRTVFNLLGPMSNPAGVKRQVMGIYDPRYTEVVANTLGELGSEHVMIVASEDGLDELSTVSITKVSEYKNGTLSTYWFDARDFGFSPPSYSELAGGLPEHNASIAVGILTGEVTGPKRDIVVLNAAAALVVAGAALDISEGIVQANRSIDSGSAIQALERVRTFCKKPCVSSIR